MSTTTLPSRIQSLWMATTPATHYPTLNGTAEADIAIVGGGIASIIAAYFLIRVGYKVTIIEADRIISATSGNTTAKITSQHTLKYRFLTQSFGKEKAALYGQSHQWAIDELERIIRKEHIVCDFHRTPAYTFAQTEKGGKWVKEEAQVCQTLGLPATFVKRLPEISFTIAGAVQFVNQAYFHPRKFLLGLVKGMKNLTIFEKNRVTNIEEYEQRCEVQTKGGVAQDISCNKTNIIFFVPLLYCGGSWVA